jgi:pimeloyl-ACP methyl ester carboxylesterase
MYRMKIFKYFKIKYMFFRINGNDIYVRDQGRNSPALVFIHSHGGSHESWLEISECLKIDFRCISYDISGYGKSQSRDDKYSIKRFGEELLQLLEELGVWNYVLVGHGVGAKIAQYIAGTKPRFLKAMVLISPISATPLLLTKEEQFRFKTAFNSQESIYDTIRLEMYSKDISPRKIQEIIWDMDSMSPSLTKWLVSDGLTEDVSANLKSIDIPILVLQGEWDRYSFEGQIGTVMDSFSNKELKIVENAGFLLMAQKPDETAGIIRGVIEKTQVI